MRRNDLLQEIEAFLESLYPADLEPDVQDVLEDKRLALLERIRKELYR